MLERPRRNRKSIAIRNMVEETYLSVNHLIYPLFLVDGNNIKDEIHSLPGNYRWSLDLLLGEIENCVQLGIQSFVLFPAVSDHLKDKVASYSYSEKNFYLTAIKEIKARFPEVCLMSDVAMDPYSSDGHDGFVNDSGEIENDKTLEILGKMSVAQAAAGIDIIGPSDMMDGRVGYIREELDEAGFSNTSIMSYTAKYASAFYGPFRDALDSAPKGGDKKSYQMNPANRKEAIREALLDESEGADFLMVKPALSYMDIISDLSQNTSLPITCYNVSGECAMVHAACKNGWLEYNKVMPEMLLGFRRAGASSILSYFAKDFAQLKANGAF